MSRVAVTLGEVVWGTSNKDGHSFNVYLYRDKYAA